VMPRGVLIALAVPAALSVCAAAAAADAAAVSFSRDLVPVLRSQCAICHLTGQEPGQMALHPRAAYKSIVGAPSVEAPLARVKPGAPEESYLLRKIEGTHLDAGGNGERMPLAQAPLDAATIAKFRAWIAAGAPEN
jgi:hypothetical protein